MLRSNVISKFSITLLLSCSYLCGIPGLTLGNRAEASDVQNPSRLTALVSPPHSVRTTDSTKRNEIYHQTLELLTAKDYSGLDQLAGTLRKSQGSYANGSWWLDTFYKTIDTVPKTESDEVWMQHIAIAQEWVKQKPHSTTARLSLAMLWKNFAWKARGGGWADTVTETMWKTYSQRLVSCSQEMAAAAKLKETDPVMMRLQLILLKATEWNLAKAKAVLADCHRRYPTYLTIDSEMFSDLLPRWHGQPGESEQLIASNVSQLKGKEAEKLYSRYVWNVDSYGTGLCTNLFSETKLSWSRCDAGLQELLKEQPNNVDLLSEFAQLADFADDKQTARILFQRLGSNYSSLVFKTPAAYSATRAHAFSSYTHAHSS